jgi:hypothetical protein
MRSNELYLSDIVQAADSIAQFVAGMDEERFVGDDLVRSAVLAQAYGNWGSGCPRLERAPTVVSRNPLGRYRRISEHRCP